MRIVGPTLAGLSMCATAISFLIGLNALPALAQSEDRSRSDYDRLRQRMVRESIEREGIKNPRVLEAMQRVPRHLFVPADERAHAYEDRALPIGHKQTITWPYVVAYMTEALDPQPTDRVLEIGTGTGYQAAVLSLLAKEVFTIEIIPVLGKSAAKRLNRLGYANVRTKIGDGYLGWGEKAPFDKIILTCSPEKVPRPLVDQLKEGGRMILPQGDRYHQAVRLLEKRDGKIVSRDLMPTYFVPMTGRSNKERSIKPDPLHPEIHNGGFEERLPDGTIADWYYQRQLTVIDRDAPEGRFCIRFDNDERGRRADARQALAIDGRRIGTLRFYVKARGEDVVDGKDAFEKASIQVSFDDYTRFVGDKIAIHWAGTFSTWESVTGEVEVPEAAREAVISIGLHGATGRLWLDDVKLRAEKR